MPIRCGVTPSTDSVRGHRDFRRLWTGLAISQVGSTVGGIALPIVAIAVVHATTFQITLLAAFSAVTTALLAFPIGRGVEFRRKRPVMITCDIVRFAAIASIPVAYVLGGLYFTQLCVVGIINATCAIAFNAASQSHLKALVSKEQLVDANARLESTRWLSISLGPSVGGALVGFLTAIGALLIDAISFLFSAVAVRLIKRPEADPPGREKSASRTDELLGGLKFVAGSPTLRRMLTSWVLFAGMVMMASPLFTILYLRELRFSPWEYGLLMGIPSLGGFFGARLTRRAVARLGVVRVLWWASILRGPWQFLIPLAMPGTLGLLMCGFAFFSLLFFAGIANSAMASYRQLQTPDHLVSRVTTFWTFASTVTQPVLIVGGGLLASVLPLRVVLVGITIVMCASALLLPRRELSPPPTPEQGSSPPAAGCPAKEATGEQTAGGPRKSQQHHED